jgi:DNA primase
MQVKEVIDYLNENISEIISHFIELKEDGRKFKTNCPFHNEKTPSFYVTPEKSMFKCFGCGIGGDAIHFIKEHEQVDFKEALEIGAKKLNLDFSWQSAQPFDQEEYKHKESLKIICAKAAEFFKDQLKTTSNAKEYLKKRDFPFIKEDPFLIGYAPNGNKFLEWAKKINLNQNLLIEAGLIKQKDGQTYDTFRNRIMFPICDKTGKVIAFTGRTLNTDTKTPKYLNTADTPIFTKGSELYGLNIARSSIRKEDRAYIVEGNTDVLRMHKIGITNTIAPCGTSFRQDQAKVLKHYTNKVTLIYDGDDAGKKAIDRNAEILIKEQFYVSVIMLDENQDPDSTFKTKKIFENFNQNHQQDYIIHKVLRESSKFNNPVFKSELIKKTSTLIATYDEPSKHEVYLDAVSNILKPKKAWQDEIKTLVADKAPVEKNTFIPKNVSLEEYQTRGFYQLNNCYFFADKDNHPKQKSNFIMAPLFHIESTINAKRLYEVTNIHNVTRVIEIPQKDMVNLNAFKIRVESLGNFLWQGNESDLNRLKAWLYEKTLSAKEITQMGWQKEGFFCWGNGIFNGKFTEANKYGIVNHKKENYYIPAFSHIYQNDETLFEFERKFIHIEGNITLNEYCTKFTNVFDVNGKIALCFLFASLFKDIVVKRFEKFPLLNLFGPKGAGKNACAESLLHFFGIRPKLPNLHNTTKPALADHVATTANAICSFDEYRNDIDMEKREFLKGLWDGTGRTRMNMDKDKKKETTKVDQGIIVCGQQMMTADIALFSRVIILSFTQTEYSDQEKQAFEELEEINKRGITHLTHQLLKQREYLKENYKIKTAETAEIMSKLLKGRIIETRIFNNWLSVMGIYSTLRKVLNFPWDYNETISQVVELMVIQNQEIKRNDDLGQFWKIIQYLISSNIMLEGGDFKSKETDSVTQKFMENGKWQKHQISWIEPKHILWLSTTRVFNLYKQQCGREGDKSLPDSTILYYLKNSQAFIFETKKESFKKMDPKTGMQVEKDGEKKRTSTTALLFDLEKLDITLSPTDEESESESKENKEENYSEISIEDPPEQQLPF